jgi:hypothetical protein
MPRNLSIAFVPNLPWDEREDGKELMGFIVHTKKHTRQKLSFHIKTWLKTTIKARSDDLLSQMLVKRIPDDLLSQMLVKRIPNPHT